MGLNATKPSDKLTVTCIGVGSQGTRVMIDLLRMPEVQVAAVCDVSRQSSDYLDWGNDELRKKVRLLLQQPNWGDALLGPTAESRTVDCEPVLHERQIQACVQRLLRLRRLSRAALQGKRSRCPALQTAGMHSSL